MSSKTRCGRLDSLPSYETLPLDLPGIDIYMRNHLDQLTEEPTCPHIRAMVLRALEMEPLEA